MYVHVLCVCLVSAEVRKGVGSPRGRVRDGVSSHVSAGNQTLVSAGAVSALQLMALFKVDIGISMSLQVFL